MKNSLANIPFLKAWLNYFIALSYKVKAYKLQIGYLNDLKHCTFGAYNSLGEKVRLNTVTMGDYSYISFETSIRNTTIGKFSSVGPRCLIGLGMHPTNLSSTHPIFYAKNPPIKLSFLSENTYEEFKPISIGNDVWVGANVIILDGVSIGDGAIIAAGSVVTKNVEPYSIVKGIPAKHSKYRFSESKIAQLLADQWWHKDIEEIGAIIQKKTRNSDLD
jgi:acetyltransferase-like isoleucine patch superfamily enzyme